MTRKDHSAQRPPRPVSRLPRPPDLVALSARLLEAKGCCRVERLPPAGRPLDLIGFDPARRRIILAAVCRRRDRFALLMALLSDARLAKLVGGGLAVAQVHAWQRRPGGGLLCEVVELGPADYPAAPRLDAEKTRMHQRMRR